MSILVVGVSHKTAPVELLETLALDPEGVQKLIADVASSEHVTEAAVIATCNRLEIYANVDRFHGSVEELSGLLVDRAARPTHQLLPHLYVHYDDGAVSHLFAVASGLDSMAVGEGQILGQTREALRGGQELGTVGPALNSVFQQALRVGKRAHAETDVDHAAPSLVQAALAQAVGESIDLADRRVLVVGAGSMAGLAVATVLRHGARDVVVVNRTGERAERLAQEYAVRAASLGQLQAELERADLVLTCTGAKELLIAAEMVPPGPVTLIDLALPHDIDPAVAERSDVTLVSLAQLAATLDDTGEGRELDGVREIVAEEVAAFLSARRQANVAPTVVALRGMATAVVEAELERLDARVPTLDPAARAEIADTVRRVAEKLVHRPTVRVKELAADGEKVSYATALAELFSLDPDAVDAVTRAEGLS
ncbi:MAG: glutamyl-tRNA reductase [Nocardioides sp.]|uniref:glutamyl-tRNA reductase n=1 Tax=Nocardioides sp. TaxID=35761 RepID=UPI0039E4B600